MQRCPASFAHLIRKSRLAWGCWGFLPAGSRRAYSALPIVLPDGNESKVNVKVGSGGHVLLRYRGSHSCRFLYRLTVRISIRHPPRPSSDGPIIFYLPRGPLGSPQEDNPLTSLTLSSGATVVCIDYRLSAQQPYPVPIHDVLAGYDWIKKHLGTITSPVSRAPYTSRRRRLGVCGELIGGSLAAMLALTECHIGRHGISVAALGNPVTDWTALFPETHNVESVSQHAKANDVSNVSGPKHPAAISASDGSLTMQALLTVRKKIFRKPAHFFDPFASPTLYFRTPSFDLPIDTSFLLQNSTSDSSTFSTNSPKDTIIKRRSHRKYPPLNSNLRLPTMRVEVGNESLLKPQVTELTELMERSIDMWKNEEQHYAERKAETRRIQLVEKEGAGLWGERELSEIGYWFAEKFR